MPCYNIMEIKLCLLNYNVISHIRKPSKLTAFVSQSLIINYSLTVRGSVEVALRQFQQQIRVSYFKKILNCWLFTIVRSVINQLNTFVTNYYHAIELSITAALFKGKFIKLMYIYLDAWLVNLCSCLCKTTQRRKKQRLVLIVRQKGVSSSYFSSRDGGVSTVIRPFHYSLPNPEG